MLQERPPRSQQKSADLAPPIPQAQPPLGNGVGCKQKIKILSISNWQLYMALKPCTFFHPCRNEWPRLFHFPPGQSAKLPVGGTMPAEKHFPLNHFLHIPAPAPSFSPSALSSDLQGKKADAPKSRRPANEALSCEELTLFNQQIMEQIRDQVLPAKFDTFFAHTFSTHTLTADAVTFALPTPYIKSLMESRYLDLLGTVVQQVLGRPYAVKFTIIPPPPALPGSALSECTKPSVKDASFTLDLVPTKEDKFNSRVRGYARQQKFKFVVDPKKTFERFVVGPSNNMAYASASAVAEKPGKAYPCLYLHSNSGLGKTHLLHAVANSVQLLHPTLVICITTARDFMTEMVDAVASKSLAKFRKKYSQEIDVLMIDDVHELKNRQGTQDEFFHVFNELHNKGKQLIFTSDKHPKNIDGVEERIKTRLTWGLVLDIRPPDLETRIAILKNKAAEEDIYLPQDVIHLIATEIKSNIRELEGALVRLTAYSSVFDINVDLEIAKEQLGLCQRNLQKLPTIETISTATAQFFKLPLADIKSKSRLKPITEARHVAMFLCHTLVKPCPTYADIGNFFGQRDHTSALHAVEKVRRLSQNSPQLSQKLLEIESNLP